MNAKVRNAWLLTLLACCFAAQVSAMVRFSSDRVTRQIFCDMPALTGEPHRDESRYTASGVCTEREAVQPSPDGAKNRSEFDQYNQSIAIWQATWSAEGSYNATTKEARETLILPAPTLDERAPPNRPYGRFVSKMICAGDPWLTSSASCTGITATATGNLGSLEAHLRRAARPFTSNEKEPLRNALIAQHEQFIKRLDAQARQMVSGARTPTRVETAPEIARPLANSTHPPNTPLTVRVQPGLGAKPITYELEFERKQGAAWVPLTRVPVAAAEAESLRGFTGWGWHQPGTPPLMTADLGLYRLRASVRSLAAGEPGPWCEFAISGEPGPGPDVLQLKRSPYAIGGAMGGSPATAMQDPPVAPAGVRKQPLNTSRTAPSALGSR